MPLFKFCNPEHNICRGAQLQVGTLFRYRDIEDQELRDENEGKYIFHITFPDAIELDPRWATLLLQGAVAFGDTKNVPRFPGSYSTKIENLHIVTQRSDSVVVKDTRIRIKRDVLNCLVFCMSIFETAEKNPFGQYDDSWSIPEHLANEFSGRLGRLIYEQAKLSEFDQSISTVHSAATVTTLSLNVRHRRVIYRDREMIITPQSRPSFDEFVTILSDIAFVKPTKHSQEQEYRFIFELQDGRRMFPPRLERLLVNPNVLTSLQ